MVSESDILATVSKYWLLMREGKRSSDTAGADCFRELRNIAANAALDQLGIERGEMSLADAEAAIRNPSLLLVGTIGLEHG